MSKQAVGMIHGLFISVPDSKQRVPQDYLALDTYGILKDKYHHTNIQRSVLITSLESYTLANTHNISMPFGSLGENILIDYNPYALPTGIQLQIGTSILEISQECTMCEHLSNINPKLPELLKHDRGIFAKVIQEGEINSKDTVYLLT